MTDEIDLGVGGLAVHSILGSGGFATVYLAEESAFSRLVAVKVLHAIDADGRRRFDRERALMGRLDDHPNVATPYSAGYTASGSPYLVMEYLRGGSLEEMSQRSGPLDAERALAYIIPVARALERAHREGILHRDIKPANILLTSEGVPKLADFGIAGIRESTATQRAFTIDHSPPETFADTEMRDERSDLYSLASTLYTLLAGHVPFAEGSLESKISRILSTPVASLGDYAADMFFQKALAKAPTDRYETASAFIAALTEWSSRLAGRSQPSSSLPAIGALPDPGLDGAKVGAPPFRAEATPLGLSRVGPGPISERETLSVRDHLPVDGRSANGRTAVFIVAPLLIAGLAWGVFSLLRDDPPVEGDGAESSVATLAEASPSSSQVVSSASSAAGSIGDPGSGSSSVPPAPGCPAEDGSEKRVTTFAAAPPICIDTSGVYTAKLQTSEGAIEWEMRAADAPATVNNFVYLARYHFYDGTTIHRVVPTFVIQGGDATGTPRGTGGPGYVIGEEPPPDGYQVGSVAMAKLAEPNTTGSQFFIVVGEAGTSLPLEYSKLGTVTSGLDLAISLSTVPTDSSDAPVKPIIIESITIEAK